MVGQSVPQPALFCPPSFRDQRPACPQDLQGSRHPKDLITEHPAAHVFPKAASGLWKTESRALSPPSAAITRDRAGSTASHRPPKAVDNKALEQTLPVRAKALPGKAAQSRVRFLLHLQSRHPHSEDTLYRICLTFFGQPNTR